MFHVPEKYRETTGPMPSSKEDGNNGIFMIPLNEHADLMVVASDGMGWEHVSVSLFSRTPTWEEMCQIKDLFWDDTDCVVQYHPPQKDYVNNHPFCLHLWCPVGKDVIRPPYQLIGFK